MSIRQAALVSEQLNQEIGSDPFGYAQRTERTLEVMNLMVGQFCADLLANAASGTGLSPTVKPASDLDGFATSIPFAGDHA